MSQPIELIVDRAKAEQDMLALMEEIEVALYNRQQQLTHMFAERVRQNLSGDVLQRRSGKLYDSVLEQGPVKAGEELVASVIAGGDEAPYGIVQEKGGERAYMIYPVNARALAFEVDGRLHFFAAVHHPPLEARPWFGPVEDEIAALYSDELQQAIGEVTAR